MKIIPTPQYASYTLSEKQYRLRDTVMLTYCDESMKSDMIYKFDKTYNMIPKNATLLEWGI